MKRWFSSTRSLPLLVGAMLCAGITLVIVRSGSRAVEDVNAGAAPGEPGGRELVTIRLNSKWKLKRASWGPVTVPEPPPEPDPEVEPDPASDRWKGLDIAVGR
jgi:hypothetical protein